MTAIALGLASSLCWGVADFMGGLQARRIALLWLILVSQGAGLCGLLVLLLVRGQGPPALLHLLPAAGGGVVGIAGLAAFYRGLAVGRMSIVAPVAATGVVLPVVVGIAEGDRPGAGQVIGILIAIVGVVLVSRDAEEPVAGGAPAGTRLAVMLALGAAVGFGMFFVGLRTTARYDVPWSLFAARGSAVLALGLAMLLTRPPVPRETRTFLWLTVIGSLDVTANGLFALATRHGLLSLVSVMSSLYPLATVLLARTLLHERVRRVQELGIAAALIGVVLIAAG